MREKIHSGRFVQNTVSGKTDIRDDPEHIGFESSVDVQGFLVVSGN